jgi:hypothetical protein
MERPPLQRYLTWTQGAAPAPAVARSNASPIVGAMKEAAGRAFHAKVRVVLGIADPGARLRTAGARARARAAACALCAA